MLSNEYDFEQYLYSKVCVPRPAKEGLKELPETPEPIRVPPKIEVVNVDGDEFKQ